MGPKRIGSQPPVSNLKLMFHHRLQLHSRGNIITSSLLINTKTTRNAVVAAGEKKHPFLITFLAFVLLY